MEMMSPARSRAMARWLSDLGDAKMAVIGRPGYGQDPWAVLTDEERAVIDDLARHGSGDASTIEERTRG